MGKITCCYGCTAETGRHLGCHDTCPKYQEQRERNQKEIDFRRGRTVFDAYRQQKYRRECRRQNEV